MTKQETFNVVKEHLLDQNAKSISPITGHCNYRGKDGMKCAVGVLIKDEHYKTYLEDNNILDKRVRAALLESGIDAECLQMLEDLQTMHDTAYVDSWPNSMHAIAIQHGVTYA